MRWLVALSILVAANSYADIGSVSKHVGTGCHIEREQQRLSGESGTAVRSMDTYITGSCTSDISFRDDTRVRVTPNSRLVIDDFVFDPKQSDAGKLALKVGMGTVRYASGQIAKNNPQQVNIKTPTATIAVRGTDFTMTVDETGESLIVLVPSCRDGQRPKTYELEENTCSVGSIQVDTEVGSVTLTRAFEATYVATAVVNPTPPVILNITESGISNNLILVKPQEIQRARRAQKNSDSEQDNEEIRSTNNRDDEEISTDITIVEETATKSKSNTCNPTSKICVRWDNSEPEIQSRGRGVAYRILENEHYAEIKTQGYTSNTRVTIVHNDSVATELIGDGSPGGNNVTIRQSTGVLR